MQGDGKKRLWTLPLLLGAGLMASAVAEENAERSKEGFIEGSEVNLLLRNFYFNRDFRKGQSSPAGGGYTEEWVQGFMANFSSGFTQGTLGVGIDAFAQLGVRLDSGGGRSGAGGSVDLLPYDDQGRPQDDYSRAGGAVKLRWYGTVLRVGDVFPETPVIQYGNSRLFPSSFRGFTLVNDSLAKGLTLQAGKLNSMTQPNSTSGSDDFYSFYTGRASTRRGSPTPAATTRPPSTGASASTAAARRTPGTSTTPAPASTIRWTTSCPCSAAPTTTRSRTRAGR